MIKEATHRLFLLCAFLLAAAAAGAQTGTIYRITLDGQPVTDGWQDVRSKDDLPSILQNAKAGDQIWLQGYPAPYQSGPGNPVYVVPDKNGLTVPAGVALYGGFRGTEASPDEREVVDGGIAYRMKYRTVLTGDILRNDQPHNVDLIFPNGQNNRSDNATHVLTLDLSTGSGSLNSGAATVVNGVTIARGHADGSGEVGGGIYVTAGKGQQVGYRIEQCFFIGNYATRGGGLYVEDGVADGYGDCLVDRCGFFNNAAGERAGLANQGGAIYLGGAGCVVNTAIFNNENGGILIGSAGTGARVLNSTVTRNTGSGIDGPAGAEVVNTVIWGNAALYSAGTESPNFQYCAYPESDGTGTNIYLSDKNNDPQGPHFNSPSLRAGFDRDYDITATLYPLWTWVPLEGSRLVDAGENDAYAADGYGDFDLAGNPRVAGAQESNGTIDIGAFEYQPVLASRIRYVKLGGTGDGTSWNRASGDLQRMIDQLAEQNPQGLPGEVWVATGTYEPQAQLITGTAYSASFRMRDGISVYGGFQGGELSKADRVRGTSGMPWDFAHETVLQGAVYDPDNLEWNNNRWTLTSDSRHVVWFAPMPGEADGAFSRPTRLDGVTVQGGYAQGGTGLAEGFQTDRGAGVYMDGADCYLTNCIVRANYAATHGGGVYLRDGRIQGCQIYHNNAEAAGGAVYVDSTGLVHRSMLTNNSAADGAGVYLRHAGGEHPEYLILSTCIVSNNTARGNGAVYCSRGGVLLQNTVVNNQCVTATDATDPDASQTGGLYVDEYALVVNNVIWNNRMGTGQDADNIPLYARNPTDETVRFLYNAISGVNNAVWNNVRQEQTLQLADANEGVANDGESIGPNFTPGSGFNLETAFGVQSTDDKTITYYWEPVTGSNLWARGMPLGQLPEEVVLAPEIDIRGTLFSQKPALGAFHVTGTTISPAPEDGKLVIYVDADCTEPDHDGSSWGTAYRSLNEAVAYFAGLETGLEGVKGFEIRVLEGDLWPRYAYVNDDPKTATLDILPMKSKLPLKIAGGYYRTGDNTAGRAPLEHRSMLNGNPEGRAMEDGFYHVVTVEAGANVELDGFHIVNGYAAGTAALQYGAGVLVHEGATVTLTGCILENNTAFSGAAVYAGANAKLTLRNCVVNNNTNTDFSNPVIAATDLTLHHVTVVNNIGVAPAGMGNSSFAAGNKTANDDTGTTQDMNNTQTLATTGADGAAHFANPTNGVGATLGFDTYLGGYSEFRPLTSSAEAADLINKASAASSVLTQDITALNDRDLGGVPDLGAYEADLPKKGRVYYVRTSDNGGDDNHDGLSWSTAFATVRKAVEAAYQGTLLNGEKPQVWVAAGVYGQDPKQGSDNCFEILDGVNVYGAFPKSGTPGMDDRHPFISQHIYHDGTYEASDYETILEPASTNNEVRRVLGQADQYNPFSGTTTYSYVNVGAGNGDYELSQEEMYVVDENGDYIYSTNGGEYIGADPAVCDYLYWERASGYYKYFTSGTDYRGSSWGDPTLSLIEVGRGYGEYTIYSSWGNYYYRRDERNGNYVEFTGAGYYAVDQNIYGSEYLIQNQYNKVAQGSGTHILTTQGYNYVGKGYGNYTLVPKGGYYYVGTGKGSYIRTANNEFSFPTRWDGFTLRNGYINSAKIDYLGDAGKRNGGAGAVFFKNVTLANSVIYNNQNTSDNTGAEIRGGGIYTDGGTIVNCYVLNNTLGQDNQYTAYGGGLYLYSGTVYNCVISENKSLGQNADGAGVFIENGEFFNNTIVKNSSSGTTRGNGGVCIYKDDKSLVPSQLVIYNCIVLDNEGYVGNMIGNANIAVSNSGVIKCYNTLTSSINSVGTAPRAIEYYESKALSTTNIFVDYNAGNYRLNGTEGLNMGENIPVIDGKTIDLFDYTDMDFTDRIKDCTIDVGAYELENIENTTPDRNGVFYVTQNGAGTSSGESLVNAACAMKLQTVLTKAGEMAAQNNRTYTVKIAGYDGENPFVYHANALASANNPQSYTYVVPAGVIVKGGYNEAAQDWDDDESNPEVRNVTEYKTRLSAIKEATSTVQEVNGYHAVTFGEWPGTEDLGKDAILDGVWLTDGSATSMAGAGNPATRGGGAIVPRGAHVRNCVVTGNKAVQGGGLYVLPGGRVSGTAVLDNVATDAGGGIYVENGTDGARAYVASCTVADNEADAGGGIYMEDGAMMALNTVVWGNTAPSDKNVSGVVNQQFADDVWNSVFGTTGVSYYPFNSSFVESREMPSDYENTQLESNEELYFADGLRRLKDYSLLIKHGVRNDFQTNLVAQLGVAEYDMQGIARVQAGNGADRLDAGAFAYEGGILPTELFTRLFVSQTTNVTLPDGEDMGKYLGRSFYTSFSTLEDALGYIRKMREDNEVQGDKSTFEILVAGGTYKPTYERDNTTADVPHDQRLYSFVVPQGVSIYGGFSGTEQISTEGTTEIPKEGGKISLTAGGEISDILAARGYSDFNGNNIYEPWELAEQTILSGRLNASGTEQNAYHVVYSEDTQGGSVLLDGLTVMDGKTHNALSAIGENNEQGRGGGIYSHGVAYTLSRCRLLDNQAVRGGAVFVRDADLNLAGCILAGNRSVKNEATDNVLDPRGGAVYISGQEAADCLRAVNTLWANNESAGEGGAIGTNLAGEITASDPMLDLMNCTFVRNMAMTNPVIFSNNAKSRVVNTLIWGNEGTGYDDETSIADMFEVSHSASDVDYAGKFAAGSNGNILLDKENMGTNGPRFANPAAEAGAGGNDARNLWNPVAISVVTDAGDGTEHTEHELEGETGHTENATDGAYSTWFADNQPVPEAYVEEGVYERYSGPRGQNNEQLCKPIDIGVYEYQYVSNFSTMPAIYVDTVSRGTGSGNEWANATDDLRGAIVGAANPTENYDDPRTVYVRDGSYSYSRISAGSAYILNMADNDNNKSLTIKGSCTGNGDQQDFSKPTVVRNAPGQSVGQLMTVATNSKPVAIEGFTFINESGTGDRKGIDASTGTDGSLTLKNTAFRLNGTGVDATSNSGSVLIVNTLFADNEGTGLASAGKTTLVNTTFANNETDMTGSPEVYNSVSWNNKTQNMPGDDGNNKVFKGFGTPDEALANNKNVLEGPNFVDPLNDTLTLRDYRIRPSLTLLNKGSNENYLKQALGDENANENTPFHETERDLYNVLRMVDGTIDIGAYEYEAPLQPIVYVKAGLTVANPDGRSWQTALGDLQGAVDLAGIYANDEQHKDVGGYVFVHGNVSAKENLRVTMADTKVYGGMNDETSSYVVYDTETGSINVDNVKSAVEELLEKRAGLLEETTRSALSGVAVSAASVVDGFEVGGPVTLSGGGYLSTSVVGTEAGPEATVGGEDDGILYNTLVYGSVSGVQAVNVTATGTIANVSGFANNRASATELNRYVSDEHWKYQLNEDDENIDKGTLQDLNTYTAMVGHRRDIAGNLRIRKTVDNGCFETWNVAEDMTATAKDYPHGKSVVYVRTGKELLLDNDETAGALYKADQAFNPGFLLLEHQAGLRGNGNYVGLTHFAVERDLGGDGTDLAAMPFKTVDNDMLYNIVDAQGITVKTYNGQTRAAYAYRFDSADSEAWDEVAATAILGKPAYTGFALGGDLDTKVRFYGKSYTESPEDKVVTLKQWNYRDPWSSPDDTGNRFTHKENMGWNLFGSPYLCAMNYTDMEYGRVLYGLNSEGNGYTTVLTYDEKTGESNGEGYIPAGDAVFTQTATLQETEVFAVEQPAKAAEGAENKSGDAYGNPQTLSLYLASASAGSVKRSATTAGGDDRLLLNAVPTERALPDFDLGIDGVKWMAADGKPQIFAVRGAGRYSLLGALDVESATTVGVTTAGAGFYEIGIPDDCPAEGYETVRLRDRKTGAEADLLQEPYVFSAVAGEDCTERFEVSFRAAADELLPGAGMTASVDETGLLRVGNLPEGTTRVTLYDAEGRAVAAAGCAGRTEADFRLTAHGVYVVQVDGGARVKIVW